MSSIEQILAQHHALQEWQANDPDSVDLEQARDLIHQSRDAGAVVANAKAREQLREILHTWAAFVHEQSGEAVNTTLPPYAGPPWTDTIVESEDLVPAPGVARRSPPLIPGGLLWVGLGVILIIAVLLLLRSFVFPPETAVPTPNTPDAQAVLAVTQTTLALQATETAVVEASNTPEPTLIIIEVVATNTPAAGETQPGTTGAVEYVVQANDTLFKIAQEHGVTVEDIIIANGLTSDIVQVDQVLIIPSPATETINTNPPGPGETAADTAVAGEPELVVRGQAGTGASPLHVAPDATADAIMSLPRGTFAQIIGRTADSAWYLVELEDNLTRGWLPAAEVGLIYPANPATLPIVITQ
jgi:LysM repeat protein